MRLCIAMVLFVLVSVPLANAAPFHQHGFDAARTGATPDPGPATDDVAWVVQLPGSRDSSDGPLIVGDHVYVITVDQGHEGDRRANEVFRIALEDGSFEPFAPVAPILPDALFSLRTLASDGEHLFLTNDDGMEAYGLADGARAWSWKAPDNPSDRAEFFCAPPAVTTGTVYLACTDISPPPSEPTGLLDPVRTYDSFLVSLDATTGAERWVWQRSASAMATDDATPADEACPTTPSSWACAPPSSVVVSLTVVEPYAFVVTFEVATPGGASHWLVRAIDTRSGAHLWSFQYELDPDENAAFLAGDPTWQPALPTASERALFVKLDQLYALNPATGARLWTESIRDTEATERDAGGGFALVDDTLFLHAAQTMYRFETAERVNRWQFALPAASNEFWGSTPLVHADGLVYARAYQNEAGMIAFDTPDSANVLYAVDAETGNLEWRRVFTNAFDSPTMLRFSVGQGAIAAALHDGRVMLIGETPASPVVVADANTPYPAPGETVRVDLSDTRPGSQGAPVRYRATWGDGTVTEWQDDPVLTHRYDAADFHKARFQVENEAGQSASAFHTFDVGGSPPNLMETIFARENQDLTFGVLGVALALGGGVIAVARSRRGHGRLKRELAAIDAADQAAGGNSVRQRASMEERRAHCHGLLLNRKIDESQFAVLERHINDIVRTARLDELDDLLGVLPHDFVTTLQSMLADGEVTRIEREGFHRLLDRSDALTKAQKRRVAGIIDAWFAEDRAGIE